MKETAQLPPGRELDALIAEKVMQNPLGRPSFEEGQKYFLDLQHYSTDIAAAWEVVERLGLAIGINEVRPEEGKWICLKDMGEGEGWLFGIFEGAYADTAPHAICLAALKAVE